MRDVNKEIIISNEFYKSWGYLPKLVKITYHFDDNNPNIFENKEAEQTYKITFTPTQCSWAIDTEPNMVIDWEYINKQLDYDVNPSYSDWEKECNQN